MVDNIAQVLLTAELHALDARGAIIRLIGEIDISSVHIVNEQFALAASAGSTQLVIDATNVTFLDSTGLHALIAGKRLIREKGSQIVLVPSRQVRRVVELVFPEPLFAARLDTVEEALLFLGLEDNRELDRSSD